MSEEKEVVGSPEWLALVDKNTKQMGVILMVLERRLSALEEKFK